MVLADGYKPVMPSIRVFFAAASGTPPGRPVSRIPN